MTPRNTLIFGKDEAVAKWVAKQIPDAANGFEPCRAIAVVSGDRPLAGVVYHSYSERSGTMQMSIASVSPLWAKKQTVAELLAYPFVQLGCRKVWAMTASDNTRAIRLLEKIGMVCEAKLRHHYGHKRAAWLFGMMRHEYEARWLLKEAA